MIPQVRELTEALGADGAPVRPLPRMDEGVAPQIPRGWEGSAADAALVGFVLQGEEGGGLTGVCFWF